MKLDKISIIGLAFAIGLIIYQMKISEENRALLAEEAKVSEQILSTTPDATSTPEETKETVNLPTDFQSEEIVLSNDKAQFTFTTATGGITKATIPQQHEVNQLDVPISLNRFGSKSIGGIESSSGESLDSGYKVIHQDDKSITFLGKLSNGAIVQKEWKFVSEDQEGAEYRLTYNVTIENPNANSLEASNMSVFIGGATPLYKGELPDQSGFFHFSDNSYKKKKSNPLKKSFFGAKLKSLEDNVEKLELAGVSNQFFTCFVIPSEPYNARYTANAREVTIAEEAGGGEKNEISLAVSLPREVIESNNGREQFSYELYAGPKHYQTLKKIGEHGDHVMNYGVGFMGFLKPIAGLLNNILTFLHDTIFGNFAGGAAWGLSIIALTMVIRTFMWPLHNVSARSMKRMSKLQPKIQELKEKHPNDPQKMQQEQMKLFSEYGINPVGGCLPMLGQIPIFFSLFAMLKSAVEFRHESFLWINDLSQPDTIYTIELGSFSIPINILPVLMFITMAIQMKMNPAPTDPTQKMITRFMPVMMVVFCYNFASALALYWTTSNIFTIFQTWLMKKLPEPELKARKVKKKGGFMEKLQKQAEEMQRMKEAQNNGNSAGMRNANPKKKRGPRTGG